MHMTTTVYIHPNTATTGAVLGEPGHRHISVRPAEGVSIICNTPDQLTDLASACITAANLLLTAQQDDQRLADDCARDAATATEIGAA